MSFAESVVAGTSSRHLSFLFHISASLKQADGRPFLTPSKSLSIFRGSAGGKSYITHSLHALDHCADMKDIPKRQSRLPTSSARTHFAAVESVGSPPQAGTTALKVNLAPSVAVIRTVHQPRLAPGR